MLTNVTYADVFEPCEKKRAGIYNIVLILAGSLLIGVSANLAVWLPFSPVPVTAQTFAVLMIGALFGSRRAGLCVLAYIAEGAAGLPVFSMGRGGLAVLFGPTGGYLVGFVAAAYIVGLLAEKGWDRRICTTILAMALGNIVIYAFGLAALSCFTGINRMLLAEGFYPFIVGDCLKIVLAATVLPSGWKLLERTKLICRQEKINNREDY